MIMYYIIYIDRPTYMHAQTYSCIHTCKDTLCMRTQGQMHTNIIIHTWIHRHNQFLTPAIWWRWVQTNELSFFSSVGCADDEALTGLFQTSFLFVFWSLYQSW